MYGNTINSDYESNVSNDVDSTIKTRLDSWYKTNIEDKGLSEYVADSGFCNDRSIISGDGVSTSARTEYGVYARLNTYSPNLICSQSNDFFTVDNSKGNQALTYPIGLITGDELMLAGLKVSSINRRSYVYSTQTYWTMSPVYYDTGYSSARMLVMSSTNTIGYAMVNDRVTYGVRPVINLASDVEIESGIGTQNDPYKIKTA